MCRVDCSAEKLMAQIWLFDLHAKMAKAKSRGDPYRKVWYLEGGRSQVNLQYQRSPVPRLRSRLFANWCCWDKTVLKNGESVYLMSWCPLEELTHFRGSWTAYVSGIKNVIHGESRGCNIFRATR